MVRIPNIWLTSDWHLGHFNILRFTNDAGERIRPDFEDLWQMFGAFSDGWHECVKPGDKIYHLGDIALGDIGKKQLLMMASWPGQKRFVRGNHDHYNDKIYHDAGFQFIYGVRQINGIWLTHIPMHPDSLSGRARGNIHGHLHGGYVKKDKNIEDERYFNVCPERIGYKPIHMEEIFALTQWDKKGFVE